MILALALAFEQQIAPISLRQIEPPIMGGMREIILGPVERKEDTLTLLVNNYEKMYDELGRAPVNFENTRIGSLITAARAAIFGSDVCVNIDTSSTRTQELKSGYELISLRMRLTRNWWVTPEGRILAEAFKLDAGGNIWSMDVKYDKETYTAVLRSPDKGTRTLGPVTPGMGMDELTMSAFRPMIKLPEEVLLREKEFWLLDPFTGAPVKHKARVKGSFNGTWYDDRVKGQEVEITGGREKQVVSLSTQGFVVKSLLENYKYLSLSKD